MKTHILKLKLVTDKPFPPNFYQWLESIADAEEGESARVLYHEVSEEVTGADGVKNVNLDVLCDVS